MREAEVQDTIRTAFYAVMARKPEDVVSLVEDKGWMPEDPRKAVPAWTDDYANIVSSFLFLQ